MSHIADEYTVRHEKALIPISRNLEAFIANLLKGVDRIDRISARAKSIDRFVGKAEKVVEGKPKYEAPFHQIQDQIGARIITYYRCDVDRIEDEILRYFHPIESKDVVPQSEWEFGYFGRHQILLLPPDVVANDIDPALVPICFELQIKTLFQHAWSEANHDLGYKPGQRELDRDDLRQLAFTSAQAWGADHIFNELFEKRNVGRG
ncbi:GTP pyrophosphokinase [Brucella grignonensis]|uniref:GTP pyrophosphokinase n=1 Tax=Brucella grignonensis TaxID=94627 RepID=UPI000B981E37|nr:RelA/SpoT domain-containing protein [Brucella grignonensis]NKB84008.1 RelA/SpoT domain-containing protein [Brucella grignonensis]